MPMGAPHTCDGSLIGESSGLRISGTCPPSVQVQLLPVALLTGVFTLGGVTNIQEKTDGIRAE